MSEIPVDVKISSENDPKGTDAATKGLKGTEDAAKGLKDTAKDLGYSLETLKAAMLELVAFAAVVAVFKEGIQESLALEKAFIGLDSAARRFGAGDGPRKEIEAFAKTLAEVAGVSESQSIPAMTRFYAITGDATEAMKLARLAADVFRGSSLTLEAAFDAVSQAALGKGKALTKLTGLFVSTGDKVKDATLLLGRLQKMYGGSAEAAGGYGKEIDVLKARMDEQKKAIGDSLMPIWVGFLKVIATVPIVVKDVVISLFQLTEAIGVAVVKAIQIVTHAMSGNMKAVKEDVGEIGKAFGTFWTDANKTWEKGAEDLTKIWVGSFEGYGDAVKRLPKPMPDPDKTMKAAKEVHDYQMDLLKEQVAASQAPLQKLEAEYALFAHERVKEAQDVLKSGVDVQARLTQVTNLEMTKRQKAHDVYVKAMKKGEDEIAAETIADINKVLTTEQKTAEVSAKLAFEGKEKAIKYQKEKFAAEMSVANASLALGVDLFGQNKELSMAQAIVSTYQAAAGALAAQPVGWWNIALAVLMVAEGLAQVAKIASTNPATTGSVAGSGFDDPSNDYAAFLGGRKWAGDMIRQFSGGASSVSQGWSAGMGASSSTDNSRHTTNINISGGILDPNSREGMKIFGRKLAVAMRDDSQRIVARRT